MKRTICFFWLLLAFSFPSAGVGEGPAFTIQAGSFHSLENAQKRYRLLKDVLSSEGREFLRLEKKGPYYVLRIGTFQDIKTAERVLQEARTTASDAYLIHSPLPEGRKHKGEKQERGASPKGPISNPSGPDQGGKERKEDPLRAGKIRAALTGLVQEAVPVSSESLGLPPGRAILRLTLRVEETKAVENAPNILKDKEGAVLTLFSENPSPLLRPGQRIFAIVEYRGDLRTRLFWLVSFRLVLPGGSSSKE